MKIEELNSCFDSITPTKEQKDRILSGIMKAKNEPVKIVKLNRYKYASVAAVLAVGVFVAVYSTVGTKNIIPQPDTQQESNATVEYAVNSQTDIAKLESDTNKKSDQAKEVGTQTNPEQSRKITKNTGFSEKLESAYPELSEENTENSPSVAMYDEEIITRTVPAPETDTVVPESVAEDELPSNNPQEDKDEANSTPNISGGGASSAYMSLETKSLSINEVMAHNVYSTLMPTVYANKFNFRTAEEQKGRLKVIFSNEQGNYMSVSIVKDGEYKFYEKVLEPEEIKNIESHGYMNFAVKCDDYYVIYNVEASDVNQVYDMVVSSEFFN